MDQGEEFDPDDDIPVAFELVLRPYAFLAAGDEVADAAGRARQFDDPWDWWPLDGDEPGMPVWPLALLTRSGIPGTHADTAAVTEATGKGSHEREFGRWQTLTDAEPTRAGRQAN
ncbi:hypothetical protein ACH4SK_27540 [Streptomyces inhibens]|uniref:hypothetical protein n=1 Tax=Streptomyces inhibens TaxID=2293571 RepID=UPI00378DEDF9